MTIYDKRMFEAYRQSVEKANKDLPSEEEKRKKILMAIYRNKYGLPKENSQKDDGISK